MENALERKTIFLGKARTQEVLALFVWAHVYRLKIFSGMDTDPSVVTGGVGGWGGGGGRGYRGVNGDGKRLDIIPIS